MEVSKCQPKLCLYRNVENTSAIHGKILKGELRCAALNPIYILDQFQVLTATQQSINSFTNDTMKTRSIYSEIIYNMSPNKKISDSLKLFGLKKWDTAILFVLLHEMNENELESIVQGELTDIDKVRELCDEKEIKKIYKIKEEELKVGSLLEAVINRISTKDIITF